MKIRNGFVSNSSASSFIVMRAHLNQRQVEAIFNIDPKEGWEIKEETIDGIEYIKGQTSMDNFGIDGFFERIGARNVAYIDSDNWSDGDDVYDEFTSNVGEDIGHEDFWRTYGERDLSWKMIARRLMAVVQFANMKLRKDLPQHPATLILNAESYEMMNWQAVHKNMMSQKEREEYCTDDMFGIQEMMTEWQQEVEKNPDLTPKEIRIQLKNKKKRELKGKLSEED